MNLMWTDLGDVIVEYQGKTIASSDELVKMVADTAPGTRATLKVIRDKKPMTLTLEEPSR
jgi:serine protease Do